MSFVVIVFVSLLSFSRAAPAVELDSSNVTSTTLNTGRAVRPNVTINLNCSCIITTPSLTSPKVTIPGLIVDGESDYRCNMKAFEECGRTCVSKMNEPIFNIESRSVGVNMTNGVRLHSYLCDLMNKGDLGSMVVLTSQMECTEKSTTFELFNSQSHSVSMSPSTSDCPTNSPIDSTSTPSIDGTTTTTTIN